MFGKRSHQKELLDAEEIPVKDLYKNLDELHFINKTLGGYGISLSALKTAAPHSATIVDIGCGGGNMLNEIRRWGIKHKRNDRLIGIDLKQDCINYAIDKGFDRQGIRFIRDDYRAISKHVDKIDIIHACLFTHHLDDKQVTDLIAFARETGATLVINDLERNAVAYYLIKWLTALFSKSYLVKNDAPLSVARGFKKADWQRYIREAGAIRYSLSWKWAFRHQVIIYAD
jgi:2-polyprenyl-3-methyl-5-hydroxy-6-metoxy-1,4-benzoquinol methylase